MMLLLEDANILPAEGEKCSQSCASNNCESRIGESVLPFLCYWERDAEDAVNYSVQSKYSIIRSNMSN